MKIIATALAFFISVAGSAQLLLPSPALVDNATSERSFMDAMEVVGGYGEGTDNFRIAADWAVLALSLGARWSLSGALTANYSGFQGGQQDEPTHDAGLTPVWRLSPNHFDEHLFRPFVEFGIGLHYLSEKQLPTKRFSTHFQFGDHLGFGVTFGEGYRYRLTYQFQHLSNGGIDAPNPGINFHLVSMGYRLRGPH